MEEIVYYLRIDAGFESIPAENYVDYMTNVMPVPERHCFFIPRLSIAIICELKKNIKNGRILEWGIRKYDKIPSDTLEVHLDKEKIEDMITFLGVDNLLKNCEECEKNLETLMKFSN